MLCVYVLLLILKMRGKNELSRVRVTFPLTWWCLVTVLDPPSFLIHLSGATVLCPAVDLLAVCPVHPLAVSRCKQLRIGRAVQCRIYGFLTNKDAWKVQLC